MILIKRLGRGRGRAGRRAGEDGLALEVFPGFNARACQRDGVIGACFEAEDRAQFSAAAVRLRPFRTSAAGPSSGSPAKAPSRKSRSLPSAFQHGLGKRLSGVDLDFDAGFACLVGEGHEHRVDRITDTGGFALEYLCCGSAGAKRRLPDRSAAANFLKLNMESSLDLANPSRRSCI